MALAETSFDASWPLYLDFAFTTEPSFVCCLFLCHCSFPCYRWGKNWRCGEGYFTPTYRGELEVEILLRQVLFFLLQREVTYFFKF